MNRDYRYQLDRSRPKIKVTCPACHHAKKLVRYIDTYTGHFLADYVGKCDRRDSCGYHYTPSDYFRDRPWMKPDEVLTYRIAKPIAIVKEPSFIDPMMMERSMMDYNSSPLFRYLAERWGETEVLRLFRLYNVGAFEWMDGASVFWNVDINGGIRTGKAMRFGNDGHRLKTADMAAFSWVHSFKNVRRKQPEFNHVQCFFGEHLLPTMPDAKVMIVESEKSAIIASHFYPQYLWLASGGCDGCLNETASQVLNGREVVLVPDLGAEEKWKEKAAMLRAITPSVSLCTYFTNLATEEQRVKQWDIADFLLLWSQSSDTPETSCSG